MIAYECLTGWPPFQGTALAVALAHRDRPLPPLPATVPRPVAELVGALTAKDPQRRPDDALAVAERARRAGVENWAMKTRIAHIRSFYRTLSPDAPSYFPSRSTGEAEDALASIAAKRPPSTSRARRTWMGTKAMFTMACMIAVPNSVVAGAGVTLGVMAAVIQTSRIRHRLDRRRRCPGNLLLVPEPPISGDSPRPAKRPRGSRRTGDVTKPADLVDDSVITTRCVPPDDRTSDETPIDPAAS